MATHLNRKRAFESPTIPDRLYFKIGDVAKICGLETYVLRFWETQFPQLKPNKSGTGQRLYRRRDVELALEIKQLVHAQGYTLSGARQALDFQGQPSRRSAGQETTQDSRQGPAQSQTSRLTPASPDSSQRLDAVAAAIGHARAELRELAALLASPAPHPVRRRPRLASLPRASDLLFPS
ncbi:MAG: MerR family transcriptional regulator [Terracidiphilus sp.]|nr:MerR family transcriptional regulator [Terracidiphilus sp.]